ncbi:MAG: hypothetical protein AB2693_33190 [Candidatus Thiodiazotropha sp.]
MPKDCGDGDILVVIREIGYDCVELFVYDYEEQKLRFAFREKNLSNYWIVEYASGQIIKGDNS